MTGGIFDVNSYGLIGYLLHILAATLILLGIGMLFRIDLLRILNFYLCRIISIILLTCITLTIIALILLPQSPYLGGGMAWIFVPCVLPFSIVFAYLSSSFNTKAMKEQFIVSNTKEQEGNKMRIRYALICVAPYCIIPLILMKRIGEFLYSIPVDAYIFIPLGSSLLTIIILTKNAKKG